MYPSSSHFNFGKVQVGQSKTMQITLTNTTGGPLTLSTNSQPTGFGFSYQGCWGIGTNSSCSATMIFTPTATRHYGGTWTMTFTGGSNTYTVDWGVGGNGTRFPSLSHHRSRLSGRLLCLDPSEAICSDDQSFRGRRLVG